MQPNEKPNTSAVFERETNREKTVVARLREVHLKESVRVKTALASAKEGDDEGEGEKKAMVRPRRPISFPPFSLCLCWERRASVLTAVPTPHTIPIFTIYSWATILEGGISWPLSVMELHCAANQLDRSLTSLLLVLLLSRSPPGRS